MLRALKNGISSFITSHKIAATIITVGLTATSLVVVAGNATFDETQTESQSVGTRPLYITLGSAGTAANRLSIAAAGLSPSDTVQRAVDLVNNGTTFTSLTLTSTATTSTLLNTDAVNGLQMVVDECSQSWTESGISPAYTYVCGGTTNVRIASRAVIGSNLTINGAALTGGATGHYRVTLTLPVGAGNTFANLNSVLSYAFTAI